MSELSLEAYAAIIIPICVAVTFLLRFLPLVLFRKSMPKAVEYVGKVLPFAMMPLLVLYCVKDTEWLVISSCIPTLVGVAVTALMHFWKKNTVLSLLVGVVVYMVLLRLPIW